MESISVYAVSYGIYLHIHNCVKKAFLYMELYTEDIHIYLQNIFMHMDLYI